MSADEVFVVICEYLLASGWWHEERGSSRWCHSYLGTQFTGEALDLQLDRDEVQMLWNGSSR